jgi:T4 RnlA family RNA ligase
MRTVNLFKELGFEEASKFLTSAFGIKVKEYENVILLNYDQIESPKAHQYVIECRSLILDRKTFDVVSRSFDRFFNLGETPDINDKFNWNTSVVFEKADGSLIKVYKHNGRWEISTRGSAYAEVDHMMGGTFRNKVLNAFGVTESQFQFVMNTDEWGMDTYIFEYTGPENRIVTRYEKPEMVLLSIRDNKHGNYADSDLVSIVANSMKERFDMNVRPVKVYSMENANDVVEMAKNLPALEEGYVAWDYENDIRIKIKNPSYVAIHHIRDNGVLSPKRICTLILNNDHEEYLSYFPEDRDFFFKYADTLEGLLLMMENAYDAHKDIEFQKEFAIQVKDYSFSGILFTARKNKISIREAWNQAKETFKIDLLIEETNKTYGNEPFNEELVEEFTS